MKSRAVSLTSRFRRRLWHLRRYWLQPYFPFGKLWAVLNGYGQYLADWRRYQRMPGAEPLHFGYSYPRLFDATKTTSFDGHYFYQAIWAMQRVATVHPSFHVDIGSQIDFVSMLSTHLPVVFVDIRPLQAKIDNFTCVSGDITHLPFKTASVPSLSCLHVAEHIGLGRYGDSLNPNGTKQACAELARVLSDGGNLYFSLPIGRQRVAFNAHRIHSPQQILNYFHDLELSGFAVVDDSNQFIHNANWPNFPEANYACGMFHFTKRL